jgi:hypothetical protein
VRARASALFLLALVLALTLGGCVVGGAEQQIGQDTLPRLVLQPGDLSDVWVPFNSGRQVRADAPAGPRSDPQRFGRSGGWIARFRRPGSEETSGPLVIESRADLFDSVDGAKDDLAAARRELRAPIRGRPVVTPLEDPRVGEEAFAGTILQRSGGGGIADVRFYLIAWRHENVVASVFVNGFEGKLTLAQALELARAQQRRIARAGS